MPELPEVETIKNQLSEVLPLKIKKITMSKVVGSILKTQDFDPTGCEIKSIRRHGKWLVFELDAEKFILSHLGMSGTWLIGDVKEKHNHLVLQGKDTLNYVDPRRFGYMYFFKKENLEQKLQELGVDIGSDDFTYEYLDSVLKRFPKRKIKPFLLDQKYFAGCGNYIANEICAHARIRPTRKAKTLTKNERLAILEATKTVLTQSVESNGVTFSGGYRDATGNKGEGVKNLVVFYQDICGLCQKNKIKKINLAARGTYYCPICQK